MTIGIRDTTEARDIRAAGWAAIMAIIPGIVVNFLTGTPLEPYPSWAWTDERIAGYFAGQQSAIAAQIFLTNAGFVLLLWAVAGVKRAVLTDTRPSLYTDLIIPSAAMATVALLAGNGLYWTAGLRGLSPEFTRLACDLLIPFGYIGSLVSVAITLFCAGIAMRRSAVFPKWLAVATPWTAIPLASAQFFLLADTGPAAPISLISLIPYLLLYLWLATTGIVMLRRSVRITPGTDLRADVAAIGKQGG
ncbi:MULTISPECIES: hypothetical protein [Mycobacterium]|uniref:Uncharacterized protein n=1 Tax=Mycobacterium pseudoshottsii TaxID=265949 RepID=A0A9N7QND7_9MYCO|nr:MULTISPECIES: hypothetical protein [Mycobacterium]EPQ45229.1 hypothetical protein MMSP_0989 [Mycobacterium sp. 012931]MBC9862529.1 hypothetical protein [Mycobacterium pseudoshottsii]RFZ64795.1 hypothetical protein DL240490_02395 [Mycobacterium marinum]BBA90567.1 hypothetical protein MPSD_53230 [Mycobacterium pseudoshottsii JCM 15466]BDN85058.1 hypothetical protein NJB1907Z4_C52730 [Mycobacterium pseudoshottsii]